MTRRFSSATKKEIAIALSDYMASSEVGYDRMTVACGRVCTESHAMHLDAKGMETLLRQLYAELPGGAELPADQEARHAVFDRFLHGCLEAYDAEEKRNEGGAGNPR